MVEPKFFKDLEEKMQLTINNFQKELVTLRTGRASPALLDRVKVDYYGTPTPLKQIANISAPEPRLIIIQPWDKSTINDIEKAILKSDLGLNPNNDGNVLRLQIPVLTEERRKDLAKTVKKKSEENKVAIRNIRRDFNEELKKQQKDGKISEDDEKKALEKTQKITDQYIKELDEISRKKEKEIMEI